MLEVNILYLTQFFSSKGGGSLLFYELAKSMSQKGHQIHVICNLSTEDPFPNISIHKVKPYIKESNLLPTSISDNIQYIINSVRAGIHVINEHHIDIIHTNSYIPIIAGSILRKIKKIPLISSIYDVFTGSISDEWEKWRKFNKLPKYYVYLGRLLERTCLSMPVNIIHSISNATTQDILGLKPNLHVETIYPSINPINFTLTREIRLLQLYIIYR